MEDPNMKKYIIILAAILTVAACAPKVEMGVVQQTGKMRFTAIHEGAVATKTYLSSEENGMYPVYWSENDKIKIFVSQHEISDGQGYQLDLEDGEGTVEAVFSGNIPELPDGSLYYYAVYPYSLAASIGGNNAWDSGQAPAEGTYNGWELSNYVQIPLPSVQQYSPHSFGREYNPAIAVTRDQTLRFKNACGLLRVNLTGNVTVGKITIQCDNEAALWGTLLARYRWKQNSSETEFMAYVPNGQTCNDDRNSSGRKLLTLDCGAGVQLSNTVTDFYFVVPTSGTSLWNGGTFYSSSYHNPLEDGFTIRISDTSGAEVFAKHTGKDNSIHRSMIRNMPTLDVRTQSFTDLSANGTANSYIVSPDGASYRFFAGNRGSSPMPIHDNPTAVLSNATTEILWETRMSGTVATELHDIVTNVSFDPSTRYISFNTTSNPGNALIALKDAADNILWSWHIWSTDYNPDATGGTDTYGSVIMMDRNLGALDDSSYGMYYQWGRKDPFDANYDLSGRRFLYYPSNPFSSVGERQTVDYLAKHPTTLVQLPHDIYNDAIYSGYPDMKMPDVAKLWGKEKTMYDPCPPGWQVADFDTYYQYAQSLSTPSFNISNQGNYVLFGHSSPSAVYPKEGIWTNYHNRTYWGAIAFYYDNAFGKDHLSQDRKNIRCQRTNTHIDIRPVIDLSAGGTANCYMAQPHNKYKFNASVKGNSNISTGMAANAKIEVYTENTTELHGTRYGGIEAEDVLIMDCYLKDGYIYFTTSLDNLYGNATIALKNPQGQILWSWHIWIVDYNPATSYDTVDWGVIGNKKFMKMNLGALNNTMYDSRAMGMMYQWGRKDPYMGAAAYDSNSEVLYEAYNSAEYGSVEASASSSTLAYALRHPGYAIMDEASGDGDWLDEHENALWGEEKTLFDPCPPGWIVPPRPIYNNHSVSSQYQYGMQMDGIWYPATGFHHPVSFNLNKVGMEGHYWYSTPKDDGHAYSFFFDSDNETVDLANHYSAKAQANAVRCMKDE